MTGRQEPPEDAPPKAQPAFPFPVPAPGCGPALSQLAAHRAAILAIAAELQLSPEQVAQAYFAELSRLAAMATVSDYLVVLVPKHVRAQLGHARTAGTR